MRRPNGFSPVYVLLVILALLIAGGAVFILFKSSKAPETPAPKVTDTEQDVPEWKTYEDKEAGFSFKYPSSVLLNGEGKGAKQPVLAVSAEKLLSIPEDLPMNMGRTAALAEKARLAKGEGENLVKIGLLNGRLQYHWQHLKFVM